MLYIKKKELIQKQYASYIFENTYRKRKRIPNFPSSNSPLQFVFPLLSSSLPIVSQTSIDFSLYNKEPSIPDSLLVCEDTCYPRTCFQVLVFWRVMFYIPFFFFEVLCIKSMVISSLTHRTCIIILVYWPENVNVRHVNTTDKLWAFDNICILTWSEEIMILKVHRKSFSSHQSSLPSIFRYKYYSTSKLHNMSFIPAGLRRGGLGVLRTSVTDFLRTLQNLYFGLHFLFL